MDAKELDLLMENLHPNSRLKLVEARELSWRMFYRDAGSIPENITKARLALLLQSSEKCFSDILENKLTDTQLSELIALPPTEVWIGDGNPPILLIPVEQNYSPAEKSENNNIDVYIQAITPIHSAQCSVEISSKENIDNA
jgi:hypothetical protein